MFMCVCVCVYTVCVCVSIYIPCVCTFGQLRRSHLNPKP